MSVVGERAFTGWSPERLCGFGFLSLSMCFISFPMPFLSDHRLACCHTTSPHHRGALAKPLIQAEPVAVISPCSFPLSPFPSFPFFPLYPHTSCFFSVVSCRGHETQPGVSVLNPSRSSELVLWLSYVACLLVLPSSVIYTDSI
jgi:hypothetical protein